LLVISTTLTNAWYEYRTMNSFYLVKRFMDISNVGLPWELFILFIGYVNMFLRNYTASHTKIINPYIHCLQKNEWLRRRKKTCAHTLCQCVNFCSLAYRDRRAFARVSVSSAIPCVLKETLVDSLWNREWYQLATLVLLVSWKSFCSYPIESNYFNEWRPAVVNAA
jgi:hypothetical protein